jgi:hypothetical protein
VASTATIADCSWCNARFVVDRGASLDDPAPVAGYAIVPVPLAAEEGKPRRWPRVLARITEAGLAACLVAWDVIANGHPIVASVVLGFALGIGALGDRWPTSYRRRTARDIESPDQNSARSAS